MFLRRLQSVAPAIIDLYPFKVDLLLDIGNQTEVGRIDVFSMTTIVEDWLEVSFESNDILGEEYAEFQSILLDYQEESGRRQLQNNVGTFEASFAGAAVWDATSDLAIPTEEDVLAIQVDALVNNEDFLLELLQLSDAQGLGDAVLDVKTSLNNPGGGGNPDTGSSSSDGLDTVIIVAIVIAALAFLLLVFAVVMAWRYRNTMDGGVPTQQKSGRQEANTGSDSDFDASSPSKRQSRAANAAVAAPPSEIDPSIDGGLYPESMISEDISSSLTAYYRSGMSGSGPLTRMSGRNASGSGGLNDAASVSSMDSYGYSLDGYASSMVGGAGKEEDPY